MEKVRSLVLSQLYHLVTPFLHLINRVRLSFLVFKNGDNKNQLVGMVIKIKWARGASSTSHWLCAKQTVQYCTSPPPHLNYPLHHWRRSSRVSIDPCEETYKDHAHLRVEGIGDPEILQYAALINGTLRQWFPGCEPQMHQSYSGLLLLWTHLLRSYDRSTVWNQKLMTANNWINSSIMKCMCA